VASKEYPGWKHKTEIDPSQVQFVAVEGLMCDIVVTEDLPTLETVRERQHANDRSYMVV
jgi:hypothetical protein